VRCEQRRPTEAAFDECRYSVPRVAEVNPDKYLGIGRVCTSDTIRPSLADISRRASTSDTQGLSGKLNWDFQPGNSVTKKIAYQESLQKPVAWFWVI